MESIAAYLHFVSVLGLGMLLAAEYVLCDESIQPGHVRLLARVDLAYLASAVAVLVSGLVGVLAVGRSPWMYLANPLFWSKVVLFFTLVAMSIYPSIRIVRWARALEEGQERVVNGRELARVRRVIGLELALLAVIPMFASLVVRAFPAT